MSKDKQRSVTDATVSMENWRALSLFGDERAAMFWNLDEKDKAAALKESSPVLRRRINLQAPGSREARIEWLRGLESADLAPMSFGPEEIDWIANTVTLDEMCAGRDFCISRGYAESAFLWFLGYRLGRSANPLPHASSVSEVFATSLKKYQDMARERGHNPIVPGADPDRRGFIQVDPADINPLKVEADFEAEERRRELRGPAGFDDDLEALAGGPL